jgi:hypothetical protein
MVPVAGLPEERSPAPRATWVTAERLPQVRGVLLGLTVFSGLVVWIFHSLGSGQARDATFVTRLRGVGIMTWLYALVQLVDMRWYHSRFARRRVAASRLPESVLGWLLAQMLAWFGILYYGLTMDPRWFVAGLGIFLLSFLVFPIRADD